MVLRKTLFLSAGAPPGRADPGPPPPPAGENSFRWLLLEKEEASAGVEGSTLPKRPHSPK